MIPHFWYLPLNLTHQYVINMLCIVRSASFQKELSGGVLGTMTQKGKSRNLYNSIWPLYLYPILNQTYRHPAFSTQEIGLIFSNGYPSEWQRNLISELNRRNPIVPTDGRRANVIWCGGRIDARPHTYDWRVCCWQFYTARGLTSSSGMDVCVCDVMGKRCELFMWWSC